MHHYKNWMESDPGATNANAQVDEEPKTLPSDMKGDDTTHVMEGPKGDVATRSQHIDLAAGPDDDLHDADDKASRPNRSLTPTPPDHLAEDMPDEANYNDLLPAIDGLFRLLVLYSEKNSGGLVDKIIIAQESVKALVDKLMPGAYRSITKIDFAALDHIHMKITGLYGSKSEIVKFLCDTGTVSEDTAELLLLSDEARRSSQHELRSGIYLLVRPTLNSSLTTTTSPPVVYVIYWPEDTTWDDSATGAVRRNRVSFMRYLTRLSDQICALISLEHSASLVWKDFDSDEAHKDDASDGEGCDSEDDNEDRSFRFEVAKTVEQGESATVHDGFEFHHQLITAGSPTTNTRSTSTTPETILLAGQTRTGFMTAKLLPRKQDREHIREPWPPLKLAHELKSRKVMLSDTIDESAMDVLVTHGGLATRMPTVCNSYRAELSRLSDLNQSMLQEAKRDTREKIASMRRLLERDVKLEILAKLQGEYPTLKLTFEGKEDQGIDEDSVMVDGDSYLNRLCNAYPEVKSLYDAAQKNIDVRFIKMDKFASAKKRFIRARSAIRHLDRSIKGEQRRVLIASILSDKETKPLKEDKKPIGLFPRLLSAVLFVGNEKQPVEHTKGPDDFSTEKPDTDFFNYVAQSVQGEPQLIEAAEELYRLARTWAEQTLSSLSLTFVDQITQSWECRCDEAAKLDISQRGVRERLQAFHSFRDKVKAELVPQGSKSDFVLLSAQKTGHEIAVRGYPIDHSLPLIEYTLWPLELTENDNQELLENPQHIPAPQTPHHPTRFELPVDNQIRHVQLLRSESLLLVVDTLTETLVWLGPQYKISALQPIKRLTLGHQYIVAVDEKIRLVAFVKTNDGQCILHVFVMDETLSSLNGRSSQVNLSPWYGDGPPAIRTATFFPGEEELCIVEHSGRARVYSFLSRGFRPATIQLPAFDYVQSTHDASALLVIQPPNGDILPLLVYHRSCFGTGTNGHGISLNLPARFAGSTDFSTTSFSQQNISLMALLPLKGAIGSVSVQISRPEAEFQLRTKGERSGPSTSVVQTQHNSLIDCFSEVWGRYPVVSAIKRETISAEGRQQEAVTFVTDNNQAPFKRYFKGIVRDFERFSRKPTQRRLDNILVHSVSFHDVDWDGDDCSIYRVGEWLVELFCLIPIHIAIARENRFMPLKDGIVDHRLEQQLLGAEVTQIIDALSLGWYESIFNTYLSTKPVKVVSSMGEQSVGKSYSLNHLIDSSFAGSAIRTTEGVWLSVCPTKDLLVVALDFEGDTLVGLLVSAFPYVLSRCALH
ncbi:hypothetical protein FRB94_014374 [Tulasnella sp. JGI-2019a]|nr:hypothetical protein FRB94_014374 [Tulasnella sp. JGI-2019a]